MKPPRGFWWFVVTDSIALSLATQALWQALGVETWVLVVLQIVGGAALGWFVVPHLARWQARTFAWQPPGDTNRPGKVVFLDHQAVREHAKKLGQNPPPSN